jgi:hypothetical protein
VRFAAVDRIVVWHVRQLLRFMPTRQSRKNSDRELELRLKELNVFGFFLLFSMAAFLIDQLIN